MTDLVVAMTTVDSREQADSIASLLVEQRLAACVQVTPIQSTYRWQGEVERADELLLLIKTTEARADAVIDAVTANHTYDMPEVVVLPASGGSAAYVAWVRESTT